MPNAIRAHLAAGNVDFAVWLCVDALNSDPANPELRRMFWPIIELADEQTRRNVIGAHGSGAMEHNYPERCMTPRFLRGCRRAWVGDVAGAKLEFTEIVRESKPESYGYQRALQREAALRLAELP